MVIGLLGTPVMLSAGWYGWGYSREGAVKVAGETRRYRIHLPLGAAGQKNMPVVIVLHGYGDHPRLTEMYSQFSRVADREKFIAVYPYGTKGKIDAGLSWNAGWCCASAVASNIDDLAFIRRLIEEVGDKYGADKARVYVVGYSNGAMLAAKAAAALGDKIAGIGLVAGSVGGQSPASSGYQKLELGGRPLPVIMFHGLTDRAVPIGGGSGRVGNMEAIASFEAYESAMNFFYSQDRCSGWTARVVPAGIGVREATGCVGGSGVTAYQVPGRGHVWFGGPLEYLIYGSVKGVNATEEMWDYFSQKASVNI